MICWKKTAQMWNSLTPSQLKANWQQLLQGHKWTQWHFLLFLCKSEKNRQCKCSYVLRLLSLFTVHFHRTYVCYLYKTESADITKFNIFQLATVLGSIGQTSVWLRMYAINKTPVRMHPTRCDTNDHIPNMNGVTRIINLSCGDGAMSVCVFTQTARARKQGTLTQNKCRW